MKLISWLRRGIARIEVGSSGYFETMGWFQSRAERAARDADGRPIPWFTYPAIALLEERVAPTLKVLEYGAGMGTLWWSRRVSSVIAIEHDSRWARRISQQCSAHLLEVAPAMDDYVEAAAGSAPFDVVIVDGLFRVECLHGAPDLLSAGGVVILDDAQRTEYRAGIETLVSQGFKSLALHGPQPVSKHPGCTAIFYRDGNVLGL